ncbi:selenide, water dikinase SelD [Flavihumibacter profundi]|uniref:selenide, water dikinase SelD n=1 Tax=Flavihumibacter profundi TaxID=2716883 RepID=UPI001CC40873|nr:selenide, water dikinase SelD [Flavihumibacter profundi]MBZ5857467.1 selenide, water dikinase SelD [Flavihumibacter profundi]
MSEIHYALTQFSHGAGCGCKISPQVLDQILHTDIPAPEAKNLLVGNQSKDDAAAYDLGNGTALISTTDFFMPIVDDAYDFGRIASANAISDVYAMGGKPLLAIAILGWPVDKLPASVARRVLEGARATCAAAGIPLAGGHSIDSPEPIFGLAVNGLVDIKNLKQNNTAKAGDLLLMTKSLGTGVLSTAQKRKALDQEYYTAFVEQLMRLNSAGAALGQIKGVHAMTDITGFGLLGHLIEMAGGSGLTAEIEYGGIPVLEGVREGIARKMVPGGTNRNWASYCEKVSFAQNLNEADAISLLADPQTNGGLLIAVDPASLQEVQDLFIGFGLGKYIEPIGRLVPAGHHVVEVK